MKIHETDLLEAFDDLWDDLVDPGDAYRDEDGQRWHGLAAGRDGCAAASIATEHELRSIRTACRALAETNEFAINGHENRISFIVGTGHTYRAAPRRGRDGAAGQAADLAMAVQDVLDEFIERNAWGRRQQEIVRRRDRDGEVFLRFFTAADGAVRVRFVEPGQIATPPERAGDPAASFGIQTDPDDVETPLAYYIDGRPVDAADIQHRKANVDANVKRGLPLFYPVRKNLRRAEKLLRNMSAVAGIQSAIALIRRHRHGTRAGIEQFAAGSADAAGTRPGARTAHYRRFAPGTILDVHGGVEYDFPAAALDAGKYVAVLQAELRAIASRLVMPEFMLTSDASNANYASTLVAEGPAVRMFARLQAEQAADDVSVMWRVVTAAIAAGRLPHEVLTTIEIQAGPPTLAVRDPLQEAQAMAIEHQAGVLSLQTWSQRRGLDYDQEQANRAAHANTQRGLSVSR
jgi:capsid protein